MSKKLDDYQIILEHNQIDLITKIKEFMHKHEDYELLGEPFYIIIAQSWYQAIVKYSN